jgi:integrase/recombinase XerD
MELRFDEFMKERRYLRNLSEKSLIFYNCAFTSWRKHSEGDDWRKWVTNCRASGISPISVNSYIRGLNALFKWQEIDIKIPFLRTEQKIIQALSPQQVALILKYKPRDPIEVRTHVVAMFILDGGYRISEVLGLHYEGVDWDNYSVKVRGKGAKYRLVPMSSGMRPILYKWASKHSGPGKLLFPTRSWTQVTVRNFNRNLAALGKSLSITGVRFSPHTLRHTFSTSYIRAGGGIYYLQRILGHTALTTTEKYLRSTGIEDIRRVHDSLSLLRF